MRASLALLLELSGHFQPEQLRGILARHPSLEAWAESRLRGLAWVLLERFDPIVAAGVLNDGYVWLAPSRGWQRHLKTMARLWREVLGSGVFQSMRCECVATDVAARRLAERAGFLECARAGELIEYRMTPC